MEEIIGFIAATCTTLSFLPQVIKVVKDSSTKALSLTMYLVFAFGVCMWLAYGIMLEQWPIIISNAVTMVLVAVIIFVKIKNDFISK